MPPSAKHKGRPGDLKRIARRRLSDDVYEQIRQAILERRFQPGERLSIPDLAARFDVSQMPVRQAVERLYDEGLVEVRPRSGTYVAEVDEKDIADTFDIRRALERLAAETAVQNVTDGDVAELEAMVKRMDALSGGRRKDPEAHDRLNSEFHHRIIALSGNRRLSEIYDELNAHLKIARVHLSSQDWGSRVEREQTEHREIVDALRRRGAEQLADVLSRHITRSKQALIGDIRRSAEQPTPDQ